MNKRPDEPRWTWPWLRPVGKRGSWEPRKDNPSETQARNTVATIVLFAVTMIVLLASVFWVNNLEQRIVYLESVVCDKMEYCGEEQR